jgi:hypothetical protein
MHKLSLNWIDFEEITTFIRGFVADGLLGQRLCA